MNPVNPKAGEAAEAEDPQLRTTVLGAVGGVAVGSTGGGERRPRGSVALRFAVMICGARVEESCSSLRFQLSFLKRFYCIFFGWVCLGIFLEDC